VCPELGRCCRQLDQGEWITVRLLEDPASEIEREGHRAKVEEGVRRILIEPGEEQLGQAGVVERAGQSLSHSEQQDCRIRFDPPRHEPEHLGGRPVEPVCVIDHEEKRCLRRPVSDQPESREADQEQVRGVALCNTERRLEGLPLGVWKEIQTAELREQELVKAREGKLGLRKRTRCGHDRNSSAERPFPCSREQDGLADSSLAAKDEGAAAVLDSVDQRVELGQVSIAS
jgi:hypothetical protein